MTQDEIISAVNEILIDDFDLEKEKLQGSAVLREDLDIDSLDALDLMVALEKRFGCKIVEEEARAMTTLQQVYDFIFNAQNK